MSTNMSTANVTTANKAQTALKKTAQDTAQNPNGTAGFEALFASALGQVQNPQAKLNTINTELQQALGKDKDRTKETARDDTGPSNEALAMNGASTLAQANLWAQRDWAKPASTVSTGSSSAPVAAGLSPATGSTTAAVASNSSANAPGSNQPAAEQASGSPTPTPGDDSATSVAQGTTPPSDEPNAPAAPGSMTLTQAQQAAGRDGSVTELSTAGNDTAPPLAQLMDAVPSQAAAGDGTVTAMDAMDKGRAIADTTATAQTNGNQVTDKTTNTLKSGADLNAQAATNSAANNTNNTTSQPNVPQRNDMAAALNAGQQLAASGKAAISANGLAAGEEMLTTTATAGTGSSTSAANAQPGIGLAQFATGRTGTAAEATIKTPVNQPGFVKELGAQVQWAIGKNLSTVDIRLNPEQFGNLNMRIVQRGQEVQLHIRTQDEATVQAMQQTLSQLKDNLAQSGLQLTQVNIQSNGNSAQQGGFGAFQQQSNNSQRQGQPSQTNNGQQPDTVSALGNESASELPKRNRSNGNIDLVA